jgi:hypothetical protein
VANNNQKKWRGRVLLFDETTIHKYNIREKNIELTFTPVQKHVKGPQHVVHLKNGNFLMAFGEAIFEFDGITGEYHEIGEYEAVTGVFELTPRKIAVFCCQSFAIVDRQTKKTIREVEQGCRQVIRMSDGTFAVELSADLIHFDRKLRKILHRSRLMCDGGMAEYFPGTIVRSAGSCNIDMFTFKKDYAENLYTQPHQHFNGITMMGDKKFVFGTSCFIYNRGTVYELPKQNDYGKMREPVLKIDDGLILFKQDNSTVVVYNAKAELQETFEVNVKNFRLLYAIMD